jgi:transposase
MKLHANAALSWSGRRLLVERVLVDRWTLTAAAEAAGVSVRCARKWVGRYRIEGVQGLMDRSSAPRRVANRTPDDRVAVIVLLRQLRMTAAEIAETLRMPLSTVSVVLKRQGMGKLGRLGLEQPVRYERSRPGELVHIDVKKLGRIVGGAGWRVRGGPQHYNRTFTDQDGHRRTTVGYEFVHIAVDDYSRLAYAEVLADEKATTAAAFLRRAIAFFARYGIQVERVLSDNGSAYRSTLHADTPTSTAQATNAPPHLTAGSGTTTIDDDTQHSATNPRPAEPTCLGPTPRARARPPRRIARGRACRVAVGPRPIRRRTPRASRSRSPS